jgi:hypothetical protein
VAYLTGSAVGTKDGLSVWIVGERVGYVGAMVTFTDTAQRRGRALVTVGLHGSNLLFTE